MSEGTDQHQGFSTPDLTGAIFLFQSHSSLPAKRVFVAHLSSLMNLKSAITKAHLPSLNQRLKIVLTNVGGRVPGRGDMTSRGPYRGCVLSAWDRLGSESHSPFKLSPRKQVMAPTWQLAYHMMSQVPNL